MVTRPLSRRERRELAAAGFRFTKRRTSLADYDANRVGAALNLLEAWRATVRERHAILAIPSARARSEMLKGERAIPAETLLRADCVLGVHYQLAYFDGDEARQRPLPRLPDGSGRRRPALEILTRGRLSDLLRLWLMLVRNQERARQSERRRTSSLPRQPRQAQGRRR